MKRTALITGGTKGIGAAIAQRLAAQEDGWNFVLSFRRDTDAAETTRTALEKSGAEVELVQVDQTEEGGVDHIFEKAKERFGSLDLFVANAAATRFVPLADLKPHHIDKTLAVTVKSYILGANRATPLMKGRNGNIIAISGMDTVHTVPFHGLLGAAKAAMETLTRYLAAELSGHKIRVNAVNPGVIDTASSRFYAGDNYEAVSQRVSAITPAGRVGTPEDVAKLVEFLISAEAEYITGTTVHVDGGLQVAPLLMNVFAGG